MILRIGLFLLVLAGLTRPAALGAQIIRNRLTLSGVTITFPAPTEANYDAGVINASSSILFTMAARNGPSISRTSIISISAASGTMGGTKSVADLEWRRSDLGTWTGLSTTPVTVEQRTFVRNGINDPWSNTVLFRTKLNWATDVPATYTATVIFTLTITTP